jgi:autotransporter-associated beta strand protein
VDGDVTGAGAFASNTLTLKGYNVHSTSSSSRKYAYVNGAITNFGKIVVDYIPASSSLQGGTTANPLLVITDDTNTTLDTGSNPNEAVEIDILCVRSGGTCANKYFKFVGSLTGDGGLTVNLIGSGNTHSGSLLLVLSGANNTYTGLTTINLGRLQIGDDTGFSFNPNNDIHLAPEIGKANYPTDADLDSTANARASVVIFHLPAGNTFQYDGMISGNDVTDPHLLSVPPNNAFIKTGAGEMILTRNHTYTGSTEVSSGTLRIGNGGTTGMIGGATGLGTASDILKIYGATAIAIVDRSDDLTLPMPIHFRNGGTLVKENSNILTVTSMQTTSGNASLDIQEGALLYRPNADVEGTALGRVLGFTGINLESGAQLILDIGVASRMIV